MATTSTETRNTSAPVRTLIRALNACIETCMDGEKGFAIAAAEVRDPRLKKMLISRSTERADFMGELQRLVVALGGFPENEGTARGALHRSWMTIGRVLAGRNDAFYLEECIRGERAAMHDYEAALRRAHVETLTPALQGLVRSQYESVRQSLEALLSWRPAVAH